jgi:YHS domain-containing protein
MICSGCPFESSNSDLFYPIHISGKTLFFCSKCLDEYFQAKEEGRVKELLEGLKK